MHPKYLRNIFRLHSILGLVNGIWMLLLGISGALLVYYQELDLLLNRQQLTVKESPQHLTMDSLFHVVKASHPEASGTTIIHLPDGPTDRISFRLYIRDGNKPITHWWDTYNMDLDPHTGMILRQGYYRNISSSFMHWAFNLHWSLNSGPPGLLIITLAGILLFLNMLTGILVYHKYFWKALLFRAPVRWKNWRTGAAGLHRYIGVWSLVFNMLIFYSGVQMNWTAFDKETWKPPTAQAKNMIPYASVDAILTKADSIFPGMQVRYVFIPFDSHSKRGMKRESIVISGDLPGTPTIIPHGLSNIMFHPNTGEVRAIYDINIEIRKMSLWQKFNAIVYSFHVGTFAGEISRVLYVAIGLTPAIMALTGFALWYRRKENNWGLRVKK